MLEDYSFEEINIANREIYTDTTNNYLVNNLISTLIWYKNIAKVIHKNELLSFHSMLNTIKLNSL